MSAVKGIRAAGGWMDELRRYVARGVLTLDIPQGYTLTIGATFGLTAHRYGSPFFIEAWGYVIGAVLAFLVIGLAVIRHPAEVPPLPSTRRVLFNVTPLLTVALTTAIVYAIPWRLLGFATAGFVAAASYALLLGLFLRFAARRAPG